MRQILEISKRELKILFYSPIGLLLIIVFVIQLSSLLTSNLQSRTYRVMSILDNTTSLTYNMFFSESSLIVGMAGNLFLYIPLLTMGLLSREFSEGTIKLLFSSPVKLKHIVLGKFLSMMVYAFVLVALVGFYGLLMGMFVINNIDIQLLLCGLLMLYLLICAYASIGLFISSLTSYQFVAALGVVGILFTLNFASRLSVDDTSELLSSILVWLQGISFLYWFKGFIGTWDILYFILIIGLFLGLTYVRLQSLCEVKPWWSKAGKYTLLVGVFVMLGYISSRPAVKFYTDVRRTEVKDTKILINRDDIPAWRTALMQGIPLTLIFIAGVRIVRRSRK